MKPNIKLTKIYHDSTTISIKDDSCNVGTIPDIVVLEIGLLNKEKDKIILTNNGLITVNDFFNGDELNINSLTLGKTDFNQYLLKIESGVIEIIYSCFTNLGNINAQVLESKVILPFPNYQIIDKYKNLLINDKVYYIDVKNSFGNTLQLTENTFINDYKILYGGVVNTNYIIHTLQLNEKIVKSLGSIIEYENLPSCYSETEFSKNKQKHRDIILKFKAIEGLRKSNDMLKIASLIEGINAELEPTK